LSIEKLLSFAIIRKMRTTLYSNEAITIVFPNGKIYSILTNEKANPACVLCGKKVLWGNVPEHVSDMLLGAPVIKLQENGRIFAFAFGANTSTMYGHTLEDSIWISVYDEKHRGHDLER